jgi:hypothetical protein
MTSGFSYGTTASNLNSRTPVPPIIYDTTGKIIQNSTLGQTVIISKNFTNNKVTEVKFMLLIEVRDESGVTQYLAWQTSTASPSSTRNVGVSWTPDRAGEYQIRTFPISNLTNPQVLDAVEIAQLAVLGADERYKVYELMFDGREYGIAYSLDNGSITNIMYEPAIATVLVELNLGRDSELVIELPNEIIFDSINCAVHPSDIDAEVFADTIPVNEVEQASTTASRLLKIQLPAGTEVVEIVGGCPLS